MATVKEVLAVVQSNTKSDRRAHAEDFRSMYIGDQEKFIQKRPHEPQEVFDSRPKDTRNITAKIVDLLSGLYDEEPTRKFTPADQNDPPWSERILEAYDFRLNQPMLREADVYARLQGVTAIQPKWRDDDEEVKFVLYTADEFDVWTKEGTPDEPEFVVTYWTQDDVNHARFWSAEETRLFRQNRPQPDAKKGEDPSPVALVEVIDENNPSGENPYGELPFAFFFNSIPHGEFFVPGIGVDVVPANWRLNEALSDLAHALQFQAHGQWWARNVEPTWAPTVGPDQFIKVEEGGEVGVLAPSLDIDGMLDYINAIIDQTLETHGIPASAFRMTKTGAASGIALVAEQLPLIEERQRRASLFRRWETMLAWKTGKVLSVHASLSLPAKEKDLGFAVDYPDPEPPVPGPEKVQQWDWELSKNLTSRLSLYMKLHPGLTKGEAERELKEIDAANGEDRKRRMENMPAGMFGGRLGGKRDAEPVESGNGQPSEGDDS